MAEYLCEEDMNTGEYISRDLALRQLNATCLATDCDNYNGVRCRACAYADAMDFIEAIPSATVQPVDRWISVDDRLPTIDERVFVYIPRPDNHNHIEIAYISEGNDDYPYWVLRNKSQFYSTRFYYISHWMPLPKPPKDGDAE